MSARAIATRCVGVAALVVAALTPAVAGADNAGSPLLGHAGRWLTDGAGRVITLHGTNLVYKYPPYFPAAGGFGDADAQFLADNGINAVRLGFAWSKAEKNPGEYDDDYLGEIVRTQQVLARHHIYSLVDSHQDGFDEEVGASWDGFPDWATFSDGLPPQPIPGLLAAYVLSPAQNRTWANFWADHPAADGVGVREHYAAMWSHVAQRFAGDPYVLGYDLINEPWPGITHPDCLIDGCPGHSEVLAELEAEAMTAIRQTDPGHILFYEPFVTTDFGAPVRISNPTGDPNVGMSFHDYCVGPFRGCPDNGFDQSAADGTVGLVTEFGATDAPALLDRVTGDLDDHMASWMLWSLTQNQLASHPQLPPTGENLIYPATATLRPYPQAVAGTPQNWHYDPGTATFTLRYTTTPADPNQPLGDGVDTEVFLPPTVYSNGYQVQVDGAEVLSAPDSPLLQLHSVPGQDVVQLRVSPA